jgi:hypothetical protein
MVDRLTADLTACIAPEPGDLRGMDRPAQCPHMVDLEVLVRLQYRGAQRLDHLHDQALCGPKGAGNQGHPHNAAERAMSCGAVDAVRASPALRPEPEPIAIGAAAQPEG